jgi:hypothetical protein
LFRGQAFDCCLRLFKLHGESPLLS